MSLASSILRNDASSLLILKYKVLIYELNEHWLLEMNMRYPSSLNWWSSFSSLGRDSLTYFISKDVGPIFMVLPSKSLQMIFLPLLPYFNSPMNTLCSSLIMLQDLATDTAVRTLSPVTIRDLMFALYRCSITAMVAGFSLFSSMRNPKNVRSHSTSSLYSYSNYCSE